MCERSRRLLTLLPVLLLAPSTARPDSPAVDADVFFEKKVRPALVEHCYACHSTSAKKAKGGLRLDSRAALLQGGDSGPALVPGSPDASGLIRAVRYTENDVKMPPRGKLPETVLADLTRWVEHGAPWPGASGPAPPGMSADQPRAESRNHWAWQPIQHPSSPAVTNAGWPTTTLDRFILAPLEAKGLRPAPPAGRSVLLRRLYFDLIGLPPTPQEMEAALSDESQEWYVKVVDRLLASPHFGERWGRHWLDVARYADSTGNGANMVFDDAWRYRDYVIDAFNADTPYDRFLIEQLAGDLLPAADDAQRARQLVATGFLMLGPKELAEYDKEKMRMDIVDEQIDTVGRAFLGLTLGCARCHDHKFDPVPTREYYALAGIFRSTTTIDGRQGGGPISSQLRRPLPRTPAQAQAAQAAADQLKKTQDDLGRAQAELKKLKESQGPERNAQTEAAAVRLRTLEVHVGRLSAAAAELALQALAVADAPQPTDCTICIRGDVHNRGPLVPRGFLTIGTAEATAPVPPTQSGRLELARWLVRPNQPLTARVMVNRVWHWLMGSGLVRSVDNFGTRGELPSHPELLDYLAVRFVTQRWSVKVLIREILVSRTYQQSSRLHPGTVAADPDNRLFGRHPRRRLEAEEIRDALLAVSGTLDRTLGGPSHTYRGRLGAEGQGGVIAADPWRRRGVYLPIYRGGYAPDLFQAFDFPDSGLVTGRRTVTTVPTQALLLMNSPFLMEQAHRTADRLHSTGLGDEQRIHLLCHSILGRLPLAAECRRVQDFLATYRQAQRERSPTAGGAADRSAWAAVAQTLLTCNEFLFLD